MTIVNTQLEFEVVTDLNKLVGLNLEIIKTKDGKTILGKTENGDFHTLAIEREVQVYPDGTRLFGKSR